MEHRSPFASRPVRIFCAFLLLVWGVLIASHVLGWRLIHPNLQRDDPRGAYGSTYTHK